MILRHLRSNVVAYLALLVAMTGTSYAAAQIANGSVTTRKLAPNAVVSSKIRNEGIKSIDIRNNNVTSSDLQDNSVNSTDLQDGSVGSADVRDRSLVRADLAAGAIPGDAEVFVSNVGATNPSATPDLAAQRSFAFTTPRGGRVSVEFFAGRLGIGCTAGGAGSIGLYVDGAPVPGTAMGVPSVANAGAVQLVGEVTLTAGAHTVTTGEDCSTDRTGTTPPADQRVTWTVELLAR